MRITEDEDDNFAGGKTSDNNEWLDDVEADMKETVAESYSSFGSSWQMAGNEENQNDKDL